MTRGISSPSSGLCADRDLLSPCGRLDGKQKNLDAPRASTSNGPRVRGVPDYDYQVGHLRFLRNAAPKPQEVRSLIPFSTHTRCVL